MDTPHPHPTVPSAFISYSWDDDAHKEWVKQFATRLTSNGVNVTLDRWDAVPGDQLPAFMERAVRENDFVITICTPTFKGKADRRGGGVGYEGDIMTAEVFTSGNHRKFIPVLRSGEWTDGRPRGCGDRISSICAATHTPNRIMGILFGLCTAQRNETAAWGAAAFRGPE